MKTNNYLNKAHVALALGACALAMIVVGCSSTGQARSATASGFLGDYSQLKEGGKGEAKLVYVAPDAHWQSYRKILMEPVTIWANEKTDKVSKEDQQALVDHLTASVQAALKDDYEFVNKLGPDVIRLRVAITEARGSNVPMDTLTTVVPQARTLTSLGGLVTGTAAFVGKAGVEGELLDSVTNQRLAAAVDGRVGQKKLIGGGVFEKWADVKDSFDFWAQRLKTRLTELRAGGKPQ